MPGPWAGILPPSFIPILLPVPGARVTLPEDPGKGYNEKRGEAEAGDLRPKGGAPRENRSMILQAGPLLISFLMFEEITAFCDLVPSEFVLYLALAGLLLSLFLDFRPR